MRGEKHSEEVREQVYQMLNLSAALIESIEPVDAVEVVRCVNCEFAEEMAASEMRIYCEDCLVCRNADANIDGYNIVFPEHFCSYGRRREDNDL